MTPTLLGRIQTRIFALVTVGLLWTVLVTPLVRLLVDDDGRRPGLGDVYDVTISALFWITVLGVGWELLYHFLQQFRWEKDWPTFFGFLTGINEGILTFVVLTSANPFDLFGLEGSNEIVPVDAYALHFITTWIVVFLFVNGPIRVLTVRYRFRGGNVVSPGGWRA